MKPKQIAFISESLKESYDILEKGKYEDKKLHKFIRRAIKDLKKDSEIGTKIPRKLWPKEYKRKYKVTNLYKYDLPNAWRLIYTVEENELKILKIILEWFSHKDYEKRFKY